jgi:hypothetical protein
MGFLKQQQVLLQRRNEQIKLLEKQQSEQQLRAVKDQLTQNPILPPEPENPVFMNYMGFRGDIDPSIAD